MCRHSTNGASRNAIKSAVDVSLAVWSGGAMEEKPTSPFNANAVAKPYCHALVPHSIVFTSQKRKEKVPARWIR